MQAGGLRAAALAGALLIALPLVIIAGMVSVDANNDGVDDYAGGVTGGALRPDAPIPAGFASWVNRAGALCTDITPALLAAQIETESSWNPQARAYNPPERGGDAMGLAQFQQGTWDSWGRDFDGDGDASPFDPEDAIMAMGTLMCDLTRWARAGLGDGSLSGDPLDVALAAYNCGRGCVQAAGGVPASGQARAYPAKVRSKVARYAAVPVVAAGGWTFPLPRGQYAVGSGFGPRGGRLHAGVDLMARKEVPILAAAAGQVILVRCNSSIGCHTDGGINVSGCGWYVDIRHAGGIITRYCHMIRQPSVRAGQQVASGQRIGEVGSTGNSSGPHLHFEVHLNDDRSNAGAVDPIAFLRGVGITP
ncbi:peptidoglycan DD-metalloendopeptidase family protein [Polymorphospora sp. NPDC050346]|uniref:peptidoglycan DD-metalloendopeptidase family protein n=1 Tax=Polymorphospora sp. NPDC050346 TaxID=3155780 RepID=UPI0033D59519